MLILICCCLHQGLVVEELEGIHLLSVLFILLFFHLVLQNIFMLPVNALQIILLLLLILVEVVSVFLPYLSLLVVDFLLCNLFLFFFIHLLRQVFSHLLLLVFLFSLSSIVVFLLLLKLRLDVLHHFLIFKLDLFLLILDDGISKRCHNVFDFVFSFFLFLIPFLFKFVLKSGIFLLHLYVLNLM